MWRRIIKGLGRWWARAGLDGRRGKGHVILGLGLGLKGRWLVQPRTRGNSQANSTRMRHSVKRIRTWIKPSRMHSFKRCWCWTKPARRILRDPRRR